MTYCLNIEGLQPALFEDLVHELHSAFAARAIEGVLHLFPSAAAVADASAGIALYPELEERTLFLETRSTAVSFRSAVLGRVTAFLADRGCEITVAEV